MTCPIGARGIKGKEPGIIAVAVAAQILQTWNCANANAIAPAHQSLAAPNRSIAGNM
jgi:xanthine dehydrogenase accessory factor